MSGTRVILPTHALRAVTPDADYELGLAAHLKATRSPAQLVELYDRFSGAAEFDVMMRRILWRARVRRLGSGLRIGQDVRFTHPETFEIGDGVFIGDGAQIQGRFDGHCSIGNQVWIGPQSFLDARALVLEDFTGIGPGVKILGSEHTGLPAAEPVIRTDLEIRPVRVGRGADLGVGAILLPGATIGEGSIVGAGSVVTSDVPPFAVVAGTPARFLRWREESEKDESFRQRFTATEV